MSWRVLILGTLLALVVSAGAVGSTDSYNPGPCRTPGTSNGNWHAKPSAECTTERTAHKQARMLRFGAAAAVILTAASLPLVIQRKRSAQINAATP